MRRLLFLVFIVFFSCSKERACKNDFLEITRINKKNFNKLNLENSSLNSSITAMDFARNNVLELFLYSDYDSYNAAEKKLVFALIKYYNCMNEIDKPLIDYR